MNTPIDATTLRAQLPAALRARLGDLECVAQIDSTNAELLRRGAAQPDLSLLVADAQSAGRGRRGRVWQSPPGANLYLSLYWRHGRDPAALAGLSLVVGLACVQALRALGFDAVGLKWPNDLLAHGRKLGGILIELAPGAAVIGIGINLAMPAPTAEAIDQPWIDLAQLGQPPSHSAVIVALLSELLPVLDEFAAHGLAPFVSRWQAHDALVGARVSVTAGSERFEADALGLASDGGLRLRTETGERVLHSAEVSVKLAKRESRQAVGMTRAEIGTPDPRETR